MPLFALAGVPPRPVANRLPLLVISNTTAPSAQTTTTAKKYRLAQLVTTTNLTINTAFKKLSLAC
jgi:hypothetical protein